MTLLSGLLLGFMLGLCAMAATWVSDEKRAVRRGFIEFDDKFYRLTLVTLRDLEEK